MFYMKNKTKSSLLCLYIYLLYFPTTLVIISGWLPEAQRVAPSVIILQQTEQNRTE